MEFSSNLACTPRIIAGFTLAIQTYAVDISPVMFLNIYIHIINNQANKQTSIAGGPVGFDPLEVSSNSHSKQTNLS